MKQILFLAAGALISATAISAKGECKADREKLCANIARGNPRAMWQCMKEHEAELSAACKNHISDVREKSRDLRKACSAEYAKFCKQKKGGAGRLVNCLKQNEAQLSEGCKTALAAPAKVE